MCFDWKIDVVVMSDTNMRITVNCLWMNGNGGQE